MKCCGEQKRPSHADVRRARPASGAGFHEGQSISPGAGTGAEIARQRRSLSRLLAARRRHVFDILDAFQFHRHLAVEYGVLELLIPAVRNIVLPDFRPERKKIVILFHRVLDVQARWLDPLDELGIENDAVGHIQKSLRSVRFIAFAIEPLAVRDTVSHISLIQAIGLPRKRRTVLPGTVTGSPACIRTTSGSRSPNRCMPVRVCRRRSGPPLCRKRRPCLSESIAVFCQPLTLPESRRRAQEARISADFCGAQRSSRFIQKDAMPCGAAKASHDRVVSGTIEIRSEDRVTLVRGIVNYVAIPSFGTADRYTTVWLPCQGSMAAMKHRVRDGRSRCRSIRTSGRAAGRPSRFRFGSSYRPSNATGRSRRSLRSECCREYRRASSARPEAHAARRSSLR